MPVEAFSFAHVPLCSSSRLAHHQYRPGTGRLSIATAAYLAACSTGGVFLAISTNSISRALFPSPLVGEGGFAKRRRMRGFGLSMGQNPSSDTDFRPRHLLPQGEKGKSEASTSVQRRYHPLCHRIRREKLQRDTLHSRCLAPALRDRDQDVAAPRHRDADGGTP